MKKKYADGGIYGSFLFSVVHTKLDTAIRNVYIGKTVGRVVSRVGGTIFFTNVLTGAGKK